MFHLNNDGFDIDLNSAYHKWLANFLVVAYMH